MNPAGRALGVLEKSFLHGLGAWGPKVPKMVQGFRGLGRFRGLGV